MFVLTQVIINQDLITNEIIFESNLISEAGLF